MENKSFSFSSSNVAYSNFEFQITNTKKRYVTRLSTNI